MKLCCYDLEKECKRSATRKEECVLCVLAEAELLHPYKVVGESETYSEYNQGWCDALDYIAARLHI